MKVTYDQAIDLLKKNQVVAYPTETVYGLGAKATSTRAIKQIFKLKGRDEKKPILLLLPSPEQVKEWACDFSEREQALMHCFWPGPLTLVFKARAKVSPLLTANSGKIGLRYSSFVTAQKLPFLLGEAITSTSANLSGQPSALSSLDIRNQFGNFLPVLGTKKLTPSLGSTIIDCTQKKLVMIREGEIKAPALVHALGQAGIQTTFT